MKMSVWNNPTGEMIMIFGSGFGIILAISIIFFNHIAAVILLSPYLWFWYQDRRKEIEKKKRMQLRKEAKDFFQSFMNCMAAGYSAEQSIPVMKKELSMIYSKEKSVLIPELYIMEQKLQVNQAFEDIFEEFAQKYQNEDFIQFAFILRTAKKKGGNLIQILDQTIDTISRKNQVEEEIITVLSGRVFEKNIMKAVPFFLICYLRIFNSQYLDVMYQTLAGRVCMAVSLVGIAAAGKLADVIVEIEV
jgi:tight adherence protein B